MQPEISLDPEDWEEFRALGHEVLDDMINFLKNIRDQSVWQPIPKDQKELFQSSAPKEGAALESIYQEYMNNFFPYSMRCAHPHFWGWVRSNGVPSTLISELISNTINANCGGGEHTAVYLERQIINWIKEVLSYPSDASGLLVSGCSVANFIGLSIARNTKAGYDILKEGVKANEQRLLFYGSEEMHISIDKALQMMGVGCDSLRKIPVDEKFEIRTDLLRERIRKDIDNGFKPICIVANAGTTNTGAIDNIQQIADIAEEFDLWVHVDGAFGVWSKLSKTMKDKMEGLERVDSVAFDLHKWMYIQYEAGCILVKNKEKHYKSFAVIPDYLEHKQKGLAVGEYWPSEYGLQLSRKDRALKIWMAFKEHGVEKLARMIDQNIQQAKYLTDIIEQESELELLSPTSMNIVNFRFNNTSADEENLNRINEEIVIGLQEKGNFVPSTTKINGKSSIRLAIVNHRSKREDFKLFVQEVLKKSKQFSY